MKKHLQNIIIFILFPLWGIGGYAQLYPVQMTPVFNSPYSIKISDYATSMDTKFQMLINPTDISINNRQVRLKLIIQGNGINAQSSAFVQGQNPIFISGGELQTLTNVDISALFRLENLQGITAVQYANPLPEGMYNFCFEMYDFVTNQKLSQKSCAIMYLQQNDPPLLNIPAKNEQIVATDFPNILFTWTPRQINATNVSYNFELKEISDPNIDPQFGFMMNPILYEQTLFSTALLYNLGMPTLIPGKQYAWRVKAVSTSGLSENAVFKNDGYSEIFYFKYASNCTAPTFLLSQTQSLKSTRITWMSQEGTQKYHLQYRTKGVSGAQWFSVYTRNTQTTLTDLEPGSSYEFRVGATCDAEQYRVEQSYVYSNIQEFTMPAQKTGDTSYNCGIKPEISIQNQKPIDNLIISESFTAGDFPVTILELSGNSPYSGKGYIIVPYLADTKIAVEFSNITINTDYQLINGIVETSYNPDWKNVADLEDFTGEGQGGQIEEIVPFEIASVTKDANGDIIVNGNNNEQIIIPGGKDTVIIGKEGENGEPAKIYTVDSNGNISGPTNMAPGGKSTPENTDGVDKNGQATAFTANGITIAFSDTSSKYAFEIMPEDAPASVQKLYAKAGTTALPYKAVVNGDSDTVRATVTTTDINIKLEDVVFKTQNGALIKADIKNGYIELTVKGNQTYAEEQVIATIKQGDKWKVIGAFMLVHISPKEVNVVLVPTDVTSQNKLDAVIANTQDIYSKVGVKINFTKEGVLKGFDDVVSGNSIETDKNTLTSTYSKEQLDINALYKGSGNNYVLFITNKTSSTGQDGYMRLNGQFGYVFPSKNEAVGPKTPAHELGHGIFKLEHPFEQYKTTASSTDLLMDYSEGTVLNHQDWKQINDPVFKLYAFQSQASGEYETDGHYSTVYLVSLMLGMNPAKALELAKATEAPDTTIHSETKFELNDTWAHMNGSQQNIHSLTGGFHGIEEFFTAIKFLNPKINDINELGKLLHRFGDTYAHTKIGNLKPEDVLEDKDLKNVDSLTIQKYTNEWKIESENSLQSEVKPWIKFFNYYLGKYGIDFLDDVQLQISIFKGKTLQQVLKDIYLTNKSSDFIMYGNSIFTFQEHALTDGGYPDQIYVRPNWYILYMKNLSWLISEKFKLDNSKLDTKIFSRMVYFVTKNKCSMKGIIDYEIAKKIGKKVFYVPVFFSDGRALATADGVLISDYLQVSKDIVQNTKKYLIEQGISENNIKVEEIKGVERKININGVFDIEAYKITVN